MRIKSGVRFASPEMAMMMATLVVQQVYVELDSRGTCRLVVTGAVEGHKHPSKHIYGGGLDFRTRDLSGVNKGEFARLCRYRLGDGFDVVLEESHLHVEYDYKD